MPALPPFALEIRDLSFRYPGSRQPALVLDRLSLTVKTGAFVCLIGQSGCGKSTLLNILAGLLPVPPGVVRLSGRPLAGPGTDRAVVFQHYSLFPWLTARQNVLFGIQQAGHGLDRLAQRTLADDYLHKVGMWEDRDKYPGELSGGMRQRVAIARALAMDARLLLLDEPFGALDAKRRMELQDLLERLWLDAATPKTVLFVTHDIEEAVLLADTILFMRRGKINAILPVEHARPTQRDAWLASARSGEIRQALLNLF